MGTQENISLDLLGDIIKGLTLDNFSYVEADALVVIKSMIKNLPGREALDQFASNPLNIKHIQEDVGKIMRLLELYGKRDLEYKTRYRSKTHLDPRYKVLDNNTQKAANKVSKGLIRVSAILDNDANISSELIRCAMRAYVGGLTSFDLANATANIFEKLGFKDQEKFFRRAVTEYNIDMQEIRRELSKIYNSIQNAKVLTEEKYKNMFEINRINPAAENIVKQLSTIWKDLSTIENVSNSVVGRLDQVTNQVEKDMMDVVPKAAYWPGIGSLPIKYIDDPSNEGWMIATVEYNGKIYEVQEDGRGRQSFKPYNPDVSSESVVSVKPVETKEEIKTVKPEVKPEVKSISQEYEKIKPLLEKVLIGKANLNELQAIKDFIQLYKSKKGDIARVDVSKGKKPLVNPKLDFRKKTFNLGTYLVKAAEVRDDIKNIIQQILGLGVTNISRADVNNLIKLESYVDGLISEAKMGKETDVSQQPKPEEKLDPALQIPDEVFQDPAQAKNMFYQLLQKKANISEKEDERFIETILKLSDIVLASDEKFKQNLAYAGIFLKEEPDTKEKDRFMTIRPPEAHTLSEMLRDLGKKFTNQNLYQRFIDGLINQVSPSKIEKMNSPKQETGLKQETGPVENLSFKSLVGKAKKKLGPTLLEEIPSEIQRREEKKVQYQEQLRDPKLTERSRTRTQGAINSLNADIVALKELQLEKSSKPRVVNPAPAPTQAFNLFRFRKRG